MAQASTVAQLRPRKCHPVEHLSFVHDLTPDADDKQRSFWHVKSTGDYTMDCALGNQLGREALRYMAGQDRGDLLSLVMTSMCRLGREHTGVEIGFASIIGKVLVAGLQARPDLIGGL